MEEKMSTSKVQNDSKHDELTKETVDKIKEDLEEMAENMRFFSLCFRALYSDQSVDGHSAAAVKFRKIRDDTRQDAIVYVKCILPVTTSFIMSFKEYFENYEALSYKEWLRKLPEILKSTKEHKDLAQTVLHMHESIMRDFKKSEDKAKIVMKEFEDLQTKYEEMCKENEAIANRRKKWATALLFVPVVNMIACPLLGRAARKNNARAVANKTEAKNHGSAALIVAETLIPALTKFTAGLRRVAGFLQILEKDLESFEKKAGKEESKDLHYKLMCFSAKDIKSRCNNFLRQLPCVRTDFEALPSQDTDQNYVDKWLEKTLADIKSPFVREMVEQILKPSQPIPAQPRHVTRGIKLPGMEKPPKPPLKPQRSTNKTDE